MKKFGLILALALALAIWGWQGYQGLGTAPAHGQPPPPPPGYYCDPYYSTCTYYNSYTAPYADPLSQFFYYTVPQIGGEIYEEHERREWREHERREHERR